MVCSAIWVTLRTKSTNKQIFSTSVLRKQSLVTAEAGQKWQQMEDPYC